jgi:6-phosphogluconolactonase
MKFPGCNGKALTLLLLSGVGAFAQNPNQLSMPIGVVTAGGSLVSDLVDPATGAVSEAQVFTGPYRRVVVDPAGRFVYAAGGATGTMLYAGTINACTGVLTSVPGSPYSLTSQATALAVEGTGHFLYVASPSGVLGASINASNGALTTIPGSPFALTTTTPVALVSNPAGTFLYASTATQVVVLSINPATGALTTVGTTPPFALSATGKGLAMDPKDRFLFAATSDGLDGYAINSATGTLTPLAGSPFYQGAGGVALGFDGTGRFLYAPQIGTHLDWGFAVDATTGNLTPLAGSPYLCTPECTGVAADTSGRYLYTISEGTFVGAVLAYKIDPATGELTYINGIYPGATSVALVPAPGLPCKE